MPSLFDLSGRVAVVIGATSGIGRTLALGLADAGADVVATGRPRRWSTRSRQKSKVAAVEGGRGSRGSENRRYANHEAALMRPIVARDLRTICAHAIGTFLVRGSTLDTFLTAVPDAAVQVVPLTQRR
jgi:NAD(P)-dependent dehydrogenase (short-subunit alcohol dehydrogenase family)